MHHRTIGNRFGSRVALSRVLFPCTSQSRPKRSSRRTNKAPKSLSAQTEASARLLARHSWHLAAIRKFYGLFVAFVVARGLSGLDALAAFGFAFVEARQVGRNASAEKTFGENQPKANYQSRAKSRGIVSADRLVAQLLASGFCRISYQLPASTLSERGEPSNAFLIFFHRLRRDRRLRSEQLERENQTEERSRRREATAEPRRSEALARESRRGERASGVRSQPVPVRFRMAQLSVLTFSAAPRFRFVFVVKLDALQLLATAMLTRADDFCVTGSA